MKILLLLLNAFVSHIAITERFRLIIDLAPDRYNLLKNIFLL